MSSSGLLQLLWLASPALPVGGFSYSEALEAAVETQGLRTPEQVADWLGDQLHLTLARGELAVLCQAVAAWRAHDEPVLRRLNDWVLHTRESAEFRLQTEQMGRSLLVWLQQLEGVGPSDLALCASLGPTYPLAFALAATHTQASVHDIALAYAFSWAENMTQAAMKAVPLGQLAGQRILAQLVTAMPPAVAAAAALPEGGRQAFTPMLAILSSQHETQYSRLFRS